MRENEMLWPQYDKLFDENQELTKEVEELETENEELRRENEKLRRENECLERNLRRDLSERFMQDLRQKEVSVEARMQIRIDFLTKRHEKDVTCTDSI